MSEPDEPDEIGLQLDAIFAEFFGPPSEMDLRGVDSPPSRWACPTDSTAGSTPEWW